MRHNWPSPYIFPYISLPVLFFHVPGSRESGSRGCRKVLLSLRNVSRVTVNQFTSGFNATNGL